MPKKLTNSIFGRNFNIKYYYSEVSVVALISNFEALPLSLLEALSHSLPIIASDVGGNSMLLSNNNGFLVPKNALSSIEHALNELNNPVVSRKMGQNSYDLFLDSFTDEVMFQKLDKFYSNLFATLAK